MMHGATKEQLAQCKISHCIPKHGFDRPVVPALLVPLYYTFAHLSYGIFAGILYHIVVADRIGQFLSDRVYMCIVGGFAGWIVYKIKGFLSEPKPTYNFNINAITCWICWWHWFMQISNWFGIIMNAIGVAINAHRVTAWDKADFAEHEIDSGESKGGIQLMLGVGILNVIIGIYLSAFVYNYQSRIYYYIKRKVIEIRSSSMAEDHAQAREARQMQPMANNQFHQPPYGGYNQQQQFAQQPMNYANGTPMQNGPQPGMPMNYIPPGQPGMPMNYIPPGQPMQYVPPGQPMQYIPPGQQMPIQGQPAQFNPVGFTTVQGPDPNLMNENPDKVHTVW